MPRLADQERREDSATVPTEMSVQRSHKVGRWIPPGGLLAGPIELLSAPLSWIAFAASQVAVGLGAVALISESHPLLAVAAFSGFCGFVAISANVAVALLNSRRGRTAVYFEVVA